jgi:hypothetical protein
VRLASLDTVGKEVLLHIAAMLILFSSDVETATRLNGKGGIARDCDYKATRLICSY